MDALEVMSGQMNNVHDLQRQVDMLQRRINAIERLLLDHGYATNWANGTWFEVQPESPEAKGPQL